MSGFSLINSVNGTHQAIRFPSGFSFHTTGFPVGNIVYGNNIVDANIDGNVVQVNNSRINGSMINSRGYSRMMMNGVEVECSTAPDGSSRIMANGVEVFNTRNSRDPVYRNQRNYVNMQQSNVINSNGSSCMTVNGLRVESFRSPDGSSRIMVNGVEVYNTGSTNYVGRRAHRAITYVSESGVSGYRDPETPNPAVRTEVRTVVEGAMGSAMVVTALEVGFNLNLIRRVLQRQLDVNGVLFNDTTALIDALLAEHQ